MKLLIVDDEELTRNGLVSSFDWGTLGIDQVLLADDGINGLDIARSTIPDIILCDVRMPRLDGIGMLERIKEFNPNTVAIFMSGYSDKEYLMSAIKMGAINYIEKPIDSKELESAIHKAIEQCLRLKRESVAEQVSANQAADSLAYYLTTPYNSCKDSVDDLCNQFYIHYSQKNKFKYICTIIVKLASASEASSELPYIYQKLRTQLSSSHIHIIYTEKRLYHLVYHIYSDSPISMSSVKTVCEYMKEAFKDLGSYYIAIGGLVEGIENTYHSYEQAVILLQKSFFYDENTLVLPDMKLNNNSENIEEVVGTFRSAIESNDEGTVTTMLDRLYCCCKNSSVLLPNQVKTYYFNLFTTLYQLRRENQLITDLSIENNENIMDIMDSCFSYDKLHQLLKDKVLAFFTDMNSNVAENKTIYLIKNFIAGNYNNASLSVKDISDYAHLSVSYLCTFFKTETGTTLNQYITEFRMDKAKQLLMDPRNKITDISIKVGYNDGNYFGKSFKKMVGLSPSEYREKVMK